LTITTGQLAVGTARVQIDGSSVSDWRLHIHNMDNTDSVYIGNETVTTATGFSLFGKDSVEMQCYPNEHIYVIATKAGHSISFLKQV
jgi:hypothetical protein